MKKYKFTWYDRKEFEFDSFDIDPNKIMYFYCSDDNTLSLNVSLYVTKTGLLSIQDLDATGGSPMRVGVLRTSSRNLPFPMGTFLPFKGTQILLKNLIGDLIIHDSYKKKSTN